MAASAPLGPVTITGHIASILWFPEKFQPAVPMMSGTLGDDCIFPAHYQVHVCPADITESRGNERFSTGRVRFPERFNDGFLLRLPYPDNDGFLKEGMKVSVIGYEEFGDEGGTWTAFDRIEILSQASAADAVSKKTWAARLRQLFQ